jgi:type II secretory pathway pseudopilin PulG
MNPFHALQQSKTSLLIGKCLIPLVVVTILAGLLSIGMFALMFYPAKDRIKQTTALYQGALQTQKTTQMAKQTQAILATTWKALPDYRTFTDLSLDIADLAKRNHVNIPGMGYDFKPLPNKLATKGTFAFEAEGPYEAIRKFIFELEKRWPYLFIEKLSVETSKKQKGVIFKLTVSTFLKEFPEPQKKTKV